MMLHTDFLDDYIPMTLFTREAFSIDTSGVNMYLVVFISGNETTEAKFQEYYEDNNSQLYMKYPRYHYLGVGVDIM